MSEGFRKGILLQYTGKVVESLIEPMKQNPAVQPTAEHVLTQNGCHVYKAMKALSIDQLDATSSHIRHLLFKSMNPLFTAAIQNSRDLHGTIYFSSALWETNAKLLLFEELDSVTLEYFCNQLPRIAMHSPGIIGSTFEMLAFRVPFLPTNYK